MKKKIRKIKKTERLFDNKRFYLYTQQKKLDE